jgi:catechol 2,3-dioxygenase-like lactoylglutathione lyase family enzyme
MTNVMLGVRSLEKSVPFYRDLLGFSIAGRVEGEFVFFHVGGPVQLALRLLDGPANPGVTEFVFEVPDVKKNYEDLKQKGIVFARVPRAVTGNEKADLFATDFRDPDGHVLSITGWVSKANSP